MALNVVTMRPTPTGAVSCGVSCFDPVQHGALILQAGIGLTCKVLAPGNRMIAVACRCAAGLHGDAPLDSKKAAEQLKILAERTLSMLRVLPSPKGVRLEVGMLGDECELLVEELASGSGHFSDRARAASITLLGIHARVRILLQLFSGSHGSLEEGTKKALLTSYGEINEFSRKQEGLTLEPSGEELLNREMAEAAETSIPILVKTLAKKTIFLLGKFSFSQLQLSKGGTFPPELASELSSLRDMCDDEHVADLAVGTLLGLHERFLVILCFYTPVGGAVPDHASRPDSLEARISSKLELSMTRTEHLVNTYLKKEGKNEG